MSFDPRVHVGTAAIVTFVRKLLVVKRSQNATHGQGQWGLPGGWIEFGEDPQAGCERELAEETGLTAIDSELLDVTHDVHPEGFSVVCIFYRLTVSRMDALKNMEPENMTR